MRNAMKLLIVLALLPTLAVGSSAFNRSAVAPRDVVTVTVDDDDAYLKLSGYGRHACFVTMQTNGSAQIHLDKPSTGCWALGAGEGINVASGASYYSRFSFHDILAVTNTGGKPIIVWVNSTLSSAGPSTFEIAKKDTAATMADTDYYAGTSATTLTLPTGDSGYVGIRMRGATTIGTDVSGWVRIDAQRNG